MNTIIIKELSQVMNEELNVAKKILDVYLKLNIVDENKIDLKKMAFKNIKYSEKIYDIINRADKNKDQQQIWSEIQKIYNKKTEIIETICENL